MMGRLIQKILKRSDSFLVAFVKRTERRRASEASDHALQTWPMVAIVLLTVSFLSLAAWASIREYVARTQTDASLVLDVTQWLTLYQDESPCDESFGHISRACPAHPENPLLWQSTSRRNDQKTLAVSSRHRENIPKSRSSSYWIGMVMPPQLLQSAAAKNATWLLLGWVRADYQVFVDGREVYRGYENDRMGIHFPLTSERLREDQPLHLAIKIRPVSATPIPDILERGLERFADAQSMALAQRTLITTAESRPLALGALNATIAIFFFILWRISSHRHEFAYMTLYTIIHTGIQLSLIDVIYKTLGLQLVELADTPLRLLEGGLGLLLAMAYTRSSKKLIQLHALSFLVMVPSAIIFASSLDSFAHFNRMIALTFVPACYGLASFSCLATGRRLEVDPPPQLVPHRIRRLYAISACFAVMAVAYCAQQVFLGNGTGVMTIYRLVHILLVVMITIVLLIDVAEQDRIIRSLPVPRWHRQVPLPGAVRSVATKADIKGSQEIREQFGDELYWKVLDAWYTTLGEEIFKRDGEITFDEGDSIIGLIETREDTVVNMLRAHAAAYLRMAAIQQRFGVSHLAYRAAIARGTVQPVWKTMLDIKRPAFTGSILIEISALMESERTLTASQHASRVVIPDELVAAIPADLYRRIYWEYQGLTVFDKRGIARIISIWRIDDTSALAVLDDQASLDDVAEASTAA